jgi:hypothetical protein
VKQEKKNMAFVKSIFLPEVNGLSLNTQWQFFVKNAVKYA